MSREKQIIEIKECIDTVYGADCAYYDVDGFAIANEIYNAGYRKQEWISVEDRLPERAGEYVCCTKTRKVIMCEYLDYWSKGSRWDRRDITHWMPLPEVPKMKGGAE